MVDAKAAGHEFAHFEKTFRTSASISGKPAASTGFRGLKTIDHSGGRISRFRRTASRIRRFIRTQQRNQYVELGRALLQKEFQHGGYEYSDKALDGVLKKYKADDADDLIAQVGEGLVAAREVMVAVFPGSRTPAAPPE